jgi:uncharacterized cupredoxin-like copper-binding protein
MDTASDTASLALDPRPRRRRLVMSALTLACAGILAACSSTGATSAPPASSSASDGGGGSGTTITATETEFKISLSAESASAGKVTFVAKNDGKIQHELVLFKTDLAPDALPTESDEAEVNEEGPGVEHIAEVEDVDPGTTKSFTVDDLEAGKYVLLCYVPGHYQSGMHVAFTVTGS